MMIVGPIAFLVWVLLFPCVKSLGNATELEQCLSNVTNVTSLLNDLSAAYSACGCGVDPCAFAVSTGFDLGLHVGAVFIILVASSFGLFVPLASKCCRKILIPPFVIILGKCAGTGVITAVALIHMLLPGNASLTNSCAPVAFNSDYIAYAFLFAMVAALLMQFVDFMLSQYFLHRQEALSSAVSASTGSFVDDLRDVRHSHSHGSLLELHGQEWSAKKLTEAYMIEFAVTIHSVFIGIAVGIADDASLVALLIGLSFHQFFEGIAVGSRLVDADLSRCSDFVFGAVFALAAPVGIAIGLGLHSTLNVNSVEFLLVQGIFDSVCAGILLYTGFSLLIIDFPRDAAQVCKGKYRWLMQLGMFAALWIGAGVLAFIGRYL
jgi:zinc transporter 1/2/3